MSTQRGQEFHPDGAAVAEASPKTILRFSFGITPEFRETPPELARLVKERLARLAELKAACEFHADFPSDTAWYDAVLERREECLAAAGRLWSWYSRNWAMKHFAFRVEGNVLFWLPDDSYFHVVAEDGTAPCYRCLGLRRFVDRGRTVECGLCEDGRRTVAPWVPAALKRLIGGES